MSQERATPCYEENLCDHLQTPQPHQPLQLGYVIISRTLSPSARINARDWLIGSGSCSIFKCTQADPARSTALINTDSAANTGGCGELEHEEAVYMEQNEGISVGLGLKRKHEYASVCCGLEELPLNKISYCATNSLSERPIEKRMCASAHTCLPVTQ